jgi:hypothetical protein
MKANREKENTASNMRILRILLRTTNWQYLQHIIKISHLGEEIRQLPDTDK